MVIPTRVVRRFTIGDAMLLIVATGFGLLICRSVHETANSATRFMPFVRDAEESIARRVWLSSFELTGLIQPLLVCWTACFAILRVGRNCPRRRRLWSQPGFVACMAALAPLALKSVTFLGFNLLPTLLWEGRELADLFTADVFREMLFMLLGDRGDVGISGPAIMLVWLILAASGRWRAEPGWIDRSGRILGLVWIAFFWIRCSVLESGG